MTRLAPLLALGCSAFLLLIPALWNGYVLFYWDSVDYVRMAFTWDMPVYRTLPYTLIAWVGRAAGSLWAVALIQAAITAWVLHETLRVFTKAPPAYFLLPVTLALVALTGLPWFTGQIMPDAWTGLMILGLACLAYGQDRLSGARRIILVAVIAMAGCFHTSHLAVGAGLVLCLGGLRLTLRQSWPQAAPAVLLPALSMGLAIALVPIIHWISLGEAFITQPSTKLMLGRLVQDGLAKRYLDETCPTGAVQLVLCDYRDDFPATANEFLWGRSPFDRLGGWNSPLAEHEAQTILAGTLDLYPLAHAGAALALTAQQLGMFDSGDGVVEAPWHLLRPEIMRYFPAELAAHNHARQKDEGFPQSLNLVHVPVLALAMAATLWLVWHWGKRRVGRCFGLALIVIVTLLGNAFVCGALSNPNHRYQSRIAWLGVVVVAVGLIRRPTHSANILNVH